MKLLLDLFGFLDVVLRGLTLVAAASTVGGVAFLCFVAAPVFASDDPLRAQIARLMRWCAVALCVVAVATTAADVGMVAEAVAVPLRDALGVDFVRVSIMLGVG